jgi:hypothetical protein
LFVGDQRERGPDFFYREMSARPPAAGDHDFLRLDARLAISQGDGQRAEAILMRLRQLAGQSWTDADAALLASAWN